MTKQDCNLKPAKKQRVTNTKTFIERATEVHGGLYSYSKSIYTKSLNNIIVTCSKHGDFAQVAIYHLSGNGCVDCYKDSKSLTTEQFIAKAISVHGSKYCYKKSVYTSGKSSLLIACNTCGSEFQQGASTHLSGDNCPLCWDLKRLITIDVFMERSVATHENLYNYSKVDFVDTKTKVSIVCNQCNGVFTQTPQDHMTGRGCPYCANKRRGYSRSDFIGQCTKNNNKGVLYVLKCYDGDNCFYKIGVTSYSIKSRFTGSKLPYEYESLHQFEFESGYIYDLEKTILRLLRLYSYKPSISFHGHTECFSSIKPIKRLLKELESTEQLQLLA